MICITYKELLNKLTSILEKEGLDHNNAKTCASIIADNTSEGVSHGIVRFERLVKQIRNHSININNKLVKIASLEGFEQWDGGHGLGPLNALQMIKRATELALIHGIGIVAIRNTTHWFRGATYGYWAAERGFPSICWTNTIANMVYWPTAASIVGNNPIVFGIPGENNHVVFDMALSQYSYGKLESLILKNEKLSVSGGFNKSGKPTIDPKEIIQSNKIFPIGMWKGSALAMILDFFASILSSGTSTFFMTQQGVNISQIFIAIHPGFTDEEKVFRKQYLEKLLNEFKEICSRNGESANYPGEGTKIRGEKSKREGIFIPIDIWNSIISL